MTPHRGSVIALAGTVLALVSALACNGSRQPNAAAGAAPINQVPVGQVPGPATQPAEPANPYGGDPVALEEGRRLFVRFNCSGCHGGRAGGGMGPSLRDPDWLYGSTDLKIHDSIAQGRAHGMPAWGTTLPDDYVWKLTAYIRSLGTPAEPHAPR